MNGVANPRWVELRLTLPTADAESLADSALVQGALAATLEDADAGTPREQPQFAEPGETISPWSLTTLSLLFDSCTPWHEALIRAAHHAGIDLPSPTHWHLTPLGETDWVRATQDHFPPIEIGDNRLWIVPTWHEPPATSAPILRLDPGLAFGTGSHTTTQLALEWLLDQITPGESCLDYGCGSGILALAAAKLGAAPVTAVDIDPDACAAAQRNAQLNHLSIRVLPAGSPLLPHTRIVANILARPLIALAPTLSALLAPGGKIALTGILAEQAESVIVAYAPWITLTIGAERDGWVRLDGTRPLP
ncbi:MAG: 50S ribosomal protein L11 methyltransferase [Hydrogenophilus sp.]|nr:50S ribosomal protein L11 methyltransferase [Hydrogenophilus sp.]